MDQYEVIAKHFQGTIETVAMSVDSLADAIDRASQLMTTALLQDRKIITCGNGPDAALAQLFASNLVGHFDQERPALPALALTVDGPGLTAIAEVSGQNDIFARQLRALAQPGDVLLCISSGRGATNLLRAIQVAHERNVPVILLSNSLDEELPPLITAQDVDLVVATDVRSRAVEVFTMTIHCFCRLIEQGLFGTHSQD